MIGGVRGVSGVSRRFDEDDAHGCRRGGSATASPVAKRSDS